MRLVTWNCDRGLAEKVDPLLALKADVFVVQECAEETLRHIGGVPGFTSTWVGDNPVKGLGVFAKTPWTVGEMLASSARFALKARVEGPREFTLYALWACSETNNYVAQARTVARHIEQNENSIFAGDFNSSSVWDSDFSESSHTALVQRLATLGLTSAYHAWSKERQGRESIPTLFHRKQAKAPHHVDYIYIPERLVQNLRSVSVGKPAEWLKLSDHMPLVLDIAF